MRGQRHAPAAPYPWERPGTHCTGGWLGLRAGLDWCRKSRSTGIRSTDRPARRQSRYRLSYRAHSFASYVYNIDLKNIFPNSFRGEYNNLKAIIEIVLFEKYN